jgi:hypothetical protein
VRHKPRGCIKNVLTSQIKVFGESRESFLLKAVAVLEEREITDSDSVTRFSGRRRLVEDPPKAIARSKQPLPLQQA